MHLTDLKLNLNKFKGKKLRWGIAGLGRFSENAIIPNILTLRKSRIISVYSRSNDRAKGIASKFGIQQHYDNFDEFLNSGIDAVYIGSANHHHYEQVIKAAHAKKHILCDKPIALTSKEAEEMVKVCEDNGVQFAVNYTYRFHPLVKKAEELIKKDLIGPITNISVNFNVHFPPGENFRFIKEQSGGGALRDIGTHMIDLLRFLGGEINDIKGVLDNIVYKSEVDDFAAAIVSFEKGGYGYFNVSFNNKRAFNRIEITGLNGSIALEDVVNAKMLPGKLTILVDGEAKKAFRKRGNKVLILLRSVEEAFIKNKTPLVTGTDGLINMKLMEKLEIISND